MRNMSQTSEPTNPKMRETNMSNAKDRISPLLFSRELTEEELAYWKQKEPWLFCDNHEPVNNDSEDEEDSK